MQRAAHAQAELLASLDELPGSISPCIAWADRCNGIVVKQNRMVFTPLAHSIRPPTPFRPRPQEYLNKHKQHHHLNKPMMMRPTDLLLSSFLLQILFTTILGWLMLLPHQPWAKDNALAKKLRSTHVTSAHVDWVILALLQLGAAVVLERVRVPNAAVVARCLVYSGWAAPLTYVFKAWGVNGFRFDGRLTIDSLVGLVGFTATTAHTYAWVVLVRAWFGW